MQILWYSSLKYCCILFRFPLYLYEMKMTVDGLPLMTATKASLIHQNAMSLFDLVVLNWDCLCIRIEPSSLVFVKWEIWEFHKLVCSISSDSSIALRRVLTIYCNWIALKSTDSSR